MILLCAGPSFAQSKPIGKIIGIIGAVEFRSEFLETPVGENPAPGKVKTVAFQPWKKAKFHQPIFITDQFRTSKKSRVKILFEDKSLIALGPNSTIEVESFLFKPKDKLRQGAIKLSHGLSMYIFNKSSNHKDSHFNIVSPTANIAARGTQGYLGVTDVKTLVANQAGSVSAQNVDPGVPGQTVVGPMMKTVIYRGKPPTPPVRLDVGELKQIRNIILGRIAITSGGGKDKKSLITVEEDEEESEEEEEESEEEETGDETADSEETDEEDSTDEGDEGEEGSTEETEEFVEEFGSEEDFSEENEPFDPTGTDSCTI